MPVPRSREQRLEVASLVLPLFPVLQQRLLLQFQPFWGLFSQRLYIKA